MNIGILQYSSGSMSYILASIMRKSSGLPLIRMAQFDYLSEEASSINNLILNEAFYARTQMDESYASAYFQLTDLLNRPSLVPLSTPAVSCSKLITIMFSGFPQYNLFLAIFSAVTSLLVVNNIFFSFGLLSQYVLFTRLMKGLSKYRNGRGYTININGTPMMSAVFQLMLFFSLFINDSSWSLGKDISQFIIICSIIIKCQSYLIINDYNDLLENICMIQYKQNNQSQITQINNDMNYFLILKKLLIFLTCSINKFQNLHKKLIKQLMRSPKIQQFYFELITIKNQKLERDNRRQQQISFFYI